MVTDGLPKTALLRAEYVRSDETRGLELPGDDRFLRAARGIEDALVREDAALVRTACVEVLRLAAEYYRVSMPQVRVLRARPIRVRECGWATELFGDYHFDEKLIRVWMRTAIHTMVPNAGMASSSTVLAKYRSSAGLPMPAAAFDILEQTPNAGGRILCCLADGVRSFARGRRADL